MKDWTGAKVAVTGGAGFIGSHLCEELVRRGASNITVIDNLSRGSRENLADIAAKVWVQPTDLVHYQPNIDHDTDAVIHLAAKVTSIEYNRTHQLDMLDTNLAINLHIAEAVRRARPGLYIYVSTACVYPHDAPVPTPEGCAEVCDPEPTNYGYGAAKWLGEKQAQLLQAEYGIPALIVRFFNAFGLRDYYDRETSHVAPALIRRVLEGEDPVEVWGTGQQTRALVDARDIARALVDLAECNAAHDGKAVNIGHEREVSIYELASTILELTGSPAELVFDTGKPDGYARRAADTTRLRELIGYVPDTPLRTTLAEMIAEYRSGKARM